MLPVAVTVPLLVVVPLRTRFWFACTPPHAPITPGLPEMMSALSTAMAGIGVAPKTTSITALEPSVVVPVQRMTTRWLPSIFVFATGSPASSRSSTV